MKTLVLIRHAKSSWDSAAVKDFDRPLNERGNRDADDMSRRLCKRLERIDVFMSSPALRARSTAERFAAAFKKDNGLILEPQLYLAAGSFFNELILSINNIYSTAAIFSHNPSITEFANTLTADMKTDNIPTCGVFAVQAAVDDWKQFPAVKKNLLFYDYPKLHS